MRVTIIGPAYPLRGGISHHVYYLKQELTRRGHDVQIVSFRKLYPKLLFPGSTVFDSSAEPLDAGAQPILSSLNPLSWSEAIATVKSFAPDLVLFQWWHSFFAPVVGRLARAFRRRGFKSVMECHNIFPHERSPFDVALLKFAARPMQHFITHSGKDRDDLLSIMPSAAVEICPLPTPRDFAGGAEINRNGRTILFFGTIRKYKGLDVLLAALPKVLAQTDCRLVIAGEFYEPVAKYQEMIRQLHLEEHVTIDNRYIPNEEVSGIFDSADVLVLPYLNATQSAVARIALSNGLPMIASRTGGLAEIVVEDENGLLFPAGNADFLASQLTRYFTENLGPGLREKIRTNSGTAEQRGIVDVLEQLA
jgi:glycosyltransferase involved in cell wall biosynthesis